MSRCLACGAEISLSARFCSSCGRPTAVGPSRIGPRLVAVATAALVATAGVLVGVLATRNSNAESQGVPPSSTLGPAEDASSTDSTFLPTTPSTQPATTPPTTEASTTTPPTTSAPSTTAPVDTTLATTAAPPPTPAPETAPPTAPAAPAAVELAVVAPVPAPACSAVASTDRANNPVTFDPANLVDGNPATAWRCPGALVGTRLSFALAAASMVEAVGLIPGFDQVDQVDPINTTDRFFQNRRVSAVTWICLAADGSVVGEAPQSLDPANRALQTVPVVLGPCQSVDLRIDAVTDDFRDRKDFTAISGVSIIGRPA